MFFFFIYSVSYAEQKQKGQQGSCLIKITSNKTLDFAFIKTNTNEEEKKEV